MKALRFELFTPTGIFKTPFSLKGIETYPLPPYSTIIGLLYTAIGRKWQGEEFQISIQGRHQALFRDYVRFRKYNRKDKLLETVPIEVPILYQLELIVHLYGEYELLREFAEGLRKPKTYLYLSGGEYAVKIRRVDFVELEERKVEELKLEWSAFLPKDRYRELSLFPSGILYLLPAFLKKESSLREHNWIEAYYLQSGTVIEEGKVLLEVEGGLPVWL